MSKSNGHVIILHWINWGRKVDMSKGDDSRVTVEMWNKIAWVYQCINQYLVMGRLRDGTLRWWRINIIKGFMNYLTITYLECSSKLNGTKKSRFNEVSRMYIWEGRVQNYIQKLLVGSRRTIILRQREISPGGRCSVHGGYVRRVTAVYFGGGLVSLGM